MKAERKPWSFPWPESDNGPTFAVKFPMGDCEVRVAPTGEGVSARLRHRVECLTHEIVLHENTADCEIMCLQHLADIGEPFLVSSIPLPTTPVSDHVLRLVGEIARLRAASLSARLTAHEEALLCREFVRLSAHDSKPDWANRAAEDLWRAVFEVR